MRMAAGALGDFVWETETSGVVRLEVAIKDQMRNLVDEGQSFGDVHLRTRVGSRMVECHTAKLEPLRCDRQKERFARTWSIADGLILEQVFALKGNSLFCSISVKNDTSGIVRVTDLGVRLPLCSVTPWDLERRVLVVPQTGRFELRLRQNGFAKGSEQVLARDLSSFMLTLEKRVQIPEQSIDFANLPHGVWHVEAEGRRLATFRSAGAKASVTFPYADKINIRHD